MPYTACIATVPTSAAGLSRCCTSCPRRCARWRSISSAGNEGRSETSARRSSVAGKFLASDRADTVIESIELPVVSEAPSCASWSAIPRELRVDVPSRSMAPAKLASPGLSGGLESLPPRNTRLAATIGTSCFSLRISVRPFGNVTVVGVASCSGCAAPGLGCVLRHGSSALIDGPGFCPAAADGAGGVGGFGGAAGVPATA